MFWRQLRENCSHLGFVWLILRHIMSEYGDLLWNSPYAVQMEEKFAPEKNYEHECICKLECNCRIRTECPLNGERKMWYTSVEH